MKFGSNVLQINTHQLTDFGFVMMSYFQDGGHDVISHRKVLPPGEWRQSICTAAYVGSWSTRIVHSYLFFFSLQLYSCVTLCVIFDVVAVVYTVLTCNEMSSIIGLLRPCNMGDRYPEVWQ